jgi:hypothetical protein
LERVYISGPPKNLYIKDLDFAHAFHLVVCGRLQMGDNLVRIDLNQMAEIGQGGGGT